MTPDQLLLLLFTTLASIITFFLSRTRNSARAQEFVQKYAEESDRKIEALGAALEDQRKENVRLKAEVEHLKDDKTLSEGIIEDLRKGKESQEARIVTLEKQFVDVQNEREIEKANYKRDIDALRQKLEKTERDLAVVQSERKQLATERDELLKRVSEIETLAERRAVELDDMKKRLETERVVFKEFIEPTINDLFKTMKDAVNSAVRNEE